MHAKRTSPYETAGKRLIEAQAVYRRDLRLRRNFTRRELWLQEERDRLLEAVERALEALEGDYSDTADRASAILRAALPGSYRVKFWNPATQVLVEREFASREEAERRVEHYREKYGTFADYKDAEIEEDG